MTPIRRGTLLPFALLFAIVACGGSDSPTDPDDDEDPEVCADVPGGVFIQQFGAFDARENPQPSSSLLLSGGTQDNSTAAARFLENADGGDVVVLQEGTSAFQGTYLWSTVTSSPRPGSVTVLGLPESGSLTSAEPVLCRLHHAEGLWMLGTDEPVTAFLSGWDQSVRDSIHAARLRGAPLAGSARGMVGFGEVVFDEPEGDVEAEGALSDPAHVRIRVVPSTLAQPELANYVVDVTRFPLGGIGQFDREGRMLVFLAHMKENLSRGTVYGVALDHAVGLTITDGTFRIDAASGRGILVYRYTGTATLEAGQPLEMDGIERIQIPGGVTGSWPIDFNDYSPVSLRVDGGVVQPD